MNRVLLLLVLSLAVGDSGLATASQKSGIDQGESLRKSRPDNYTKSWPRLSIGKAKFSVLLPAVSDPIVRDISQGGTALTMYAYQGREQGSEYNVVCIGELPDRLLAPEAVTFLFASGPRNLLESARRAGKNKLQLSDQQDISLGGYKGRQFTLKSANETVISRGYIVDRFFITLSVSYRDNTEAADDARMFLESFTITR